MESQPLNLVCESQRKNNLPLETEILDLSHKNMTLPPIEIKLDKSIPSTSISSRNIDVQQALESFNSSKEWNNAPIENFSIMPPMQLLNMKHDPIYSNNGSNNNQLNSSLESIPYRSNLLQIGLNYANLPKFSAETLASVQTELSTLSRTNQKILRPFKAYPSELLTLSADAIDDETSKLKYKEYRNRTLKCVKKGKDENTEKTNSKMRRTINRSGSPTSTIDEKDANYWERRRKNNEAAKRSRDARRAKEDELAIRTAYLEQENMRLSSLIHELMNELMRSYVKNGNVKNE